VTRAAPCPLLPLGGDSTAEALADPALVKAGWTPRFLADAARRREAEDLYGHLGFEVMAAAVDPKGLGPECEGCLAAACDGYVMLYTRQSRKASMPPSPSKEKQQ